MIYLSHPLSVDTPAYAGSKGIEIEKTKSICDGDSCNQLYFSMSNHIGTHVDVPAHFDEDGKTITDYQPLDWVFSRCCLIDISCEPGQIIDAEAVRKKDPDFECDLLIVRTGFEAFRDEVIYWQQSPVFHKDLGAYFEVAFNSLSAVAFDCISLSSMVNRNMGRDAHREILGRGIRVFEDVKLSILDKSPVEIIAVPLLIECADGAPVTMVARS